MLYIPEPENDFVFPIVVEELGFVGGLVVLVLFALLILRGYWLALNARDKFGAPHHRGDHHPAGGAGVLNIGVVTNLIPNTGISLPVLQLRRDRPDDPAGRDGDGAEYLAADPAPQARLVDDVNTKSCFQKKYYLRWSI